ncbi:hypothetical protein [Emticicia sp. SJ17W-69]|uniref:hypothetical protein n=1 Tax=Emticicia sp. SJ17W-69 TaxID=3421657 RepID=UPI003EB77789
MKKNFIIIAVFVLFSCVNTIKPTDDYRINLRWIKSSAGEDGEKATKGILWALAYVGAELPKESIKKGIFLNENQIFQLDFSALGFDENALKAWSKLITFSKKTEEYKKYGSIDLSRFLVFTVYSPWHYYQITGVSTSLDSFFDNSLNSAKFDFFPVTHSSVTDGHRLLKYRIESNVEKSKFLAIEGDGKLTDSTFREAEYEAIDLMKNGQLRYAIYNLNGKLSDFAQKKYSSAGNPAKCMWCHEGVLAPLFTENQAVRGYKLPQDFNSEMLQTQLIINIYRNSRNSTIDFNIHKDHELSEILYTSFMEPSAERLAQEWKISVEEVKAKLETLKTHRNHEFVFLGELFDRNEVEKYAPFQSIPFPSSIREQNNNELNIFK